MATIPDHVDQRPRCGNYGDNFAAASIAVQELLHGNREEGLRQLREIRHWIFSHGEMKSLKWLLPEIESILACFGSPQSEDDMLASLAPACGR